jgi:tellurium resistance protein TerD
MAISLNKGDKFNLSKKEPSLKKVMVGLGWEIKSGNTLDIDASVFMIGSNRKLPADEFFVFYNNLKSPDGAVQHTGDNRTGMGDGDDEMVLVNLPMIDNRVTELVFVVTIHEARVKMQNFGLLNDAYVRVVDVETKREILRYDLDASNANDTEVEFGKLQRIDNDWYFAALGIGSQKGLQGFVDTYA